MINIALKTTSVSMIIGCMILLVACGEKDKQKELAAYKAQYGKKDKQKELAAYKAQYRTLEKKIASLEKELGITEMGKSYPVSIITVAKNKFLSYIDIPGTITSKQNIRVYAEMPGNITHIYIKEGQFVNKGTLIAQQDASTISSQLGQLKANLMLAKTTYERHKRLWEQKIGSEIQYLQSKTSVEALEEQIKSIKTQVAKYSIHSPISGVVDEIFINQGETPAGPIARITNLNNIQMEAQLSEEYIGKVKKGDLVTIIATHLGLEKHTRITSIGQIIDPVSRTFRVEAALSNPGRKLKPNMTATMKIILNQIHDVITIPANIIQRDGEKNFVFISKKKDKKEIAVKRYITIIDIYQGIAAIDKGLFEGDMLIVEGHTEMRDSLSIMGTNASTNVNSQY